MADSVPITHTHSSREKGDKEALAIVYGVTPYGRRFLICLDHKHLFSEQRGIPATASARVQRWALSGYQYSIMHKLGDQIGNAYDSLSVPDGILSNNSSQEIGSSAVTAQMGRSGSRQ